jgi:undecaprenyl-diphosphatase
VEEGSALDTAIVEWLNSGVGRFPWWDAFIEAMVSDYLVPVLGSLVLLGFWFWGRGQVRIGNQLTTIAGAMSIGLANLVTLLINDIYFRARPFWDLDVQLLFYEPTDSSFPSNAAALGFAIATAIFMRRRRLGLAMYGLAFFYAFARVYSGVHYPSDALGGAAIGVAAGLTAHGITHLLAPLLRRVMRVARVLYLA